MDIGVVAQRGNERATALAGDVVDALAGDGVTVLVDPTTADELGVAGYPVESMVDFPLVVSIGGDGTFLFVARRVGSTPILGVNVGEVGFLNAVSPADATDRVAEEVARIRDHGAPTFREVPRLAAAGEGLSLPPALNEIVVQGPQRGRRQGMEAEVRIDGSAYTATHADGILVATPTGSTAYNLSERGPLVHPLVSGLVVNEMAAVEPMPPLVVAQDAAITVHASGPSEVVVASDGSEHQWVDTPATVTVAVHDEPARIAGPRSNFFEALEKLN